MLRKKWRKEREKEQQEKEVKSYTNNQLQSVLATMVTRIPDY